MAATRQARAGIPISVKLIITTSIVIAAAVGTATWFSQTSISDLTEKQVAARRESGERSIVRESELVVQAVANTIVIPMSTQMLADIQPALDTAMKGEDRVQWLIAYDAAAARIVAATTGAPARVDEVVRI
ncbi:MAG TPA: hypothetical protein VK427_23685, partial [Kofleriaceae bacterium]|nr:hypothetical protein [Kofleriaceae bacterium]